MKKILVLFVSVVFIASTGIAQSETLNSTTIAPEAFSQKMVELPSAPIIDVRTPEEYSEGHLADAINYDWYSEDFKDNVSKLDKSQPVFIYCRSGHRSGEAKKAMKAMGFEKVYELKGGVLAWEEAELPMTEPTKAATPSEQ